MDEAKRKMIEEEMKLPWFDTTPEEDAFRRGYHQGFIAGRTQEDVTIDEVRNWRHNYRQKDVCPPGSPMEGVIRNSEKPLGEVLMELPEDGIEFFSNN